MKTNSFARLALGAASGMVVLMAMTIGTAAAQWTPSTADFLFSSHPMISGTVVSVNDHEMVVDTDQGQQVTLQVDSRTLAPRDFGPGMVMRAEFQASEECRLYALRIIPIRQGMSTRREQAYANTRDGGTVMATGFSANNGASRPRVTGSDADGWSMLATSSTTDYLFSNRPMLTGQVISVTDHRMVVATDQGQTVALAMDSRTLLSRDVGPGSIVRTQIATFKDGRHYAQRVSKIGEGVIGREQTYAHTTDNDLRFASTPPDCEPVPTSNTQTSYEAPPARIPVAKAPVAVVAEATPVDEPEEALPQTASNQPLILLFGLGALGLAGLVAAARAIRVG